MKGNMDTQRFLWALLFSFSLLMLWENWEKQHQVGAPNPVSVEGKEKHAGAGDVPHFDSKLGGLAPGVGKGEVAEKAKGQKLTVSTDVLKVDLSSNGGSIVRVELLKHKAEGDENSNFVLIDGEGPYEFVAESGLIGSDLPTHKTAYQVPAGNLELADGKDKLELRLSPVAQGPVNVTKVYTFHRGSYLIDLSYEISNSGSVQIAPYGYFQFVRNSTSTDGESSMMGGGTFTGPAIYTDAKKFQTFEFGNIEKGGEKNTQKASDGWVAMVQHYFVSAWLPHEGVEREFFLRKLSDKLFASGVVVPIGDIAPGGKAELSMPVYVGPQDQSKLKDIAPGFDLVANYGWLTVVALPLFWVLEWLEKVVGNWGWAIIVLTILIKLAFFPLSAASYRSMARMRVVTPKLQRLKEQFGHDKAKLNQEMMELYKKEKINPLGGCLPILVQIPVFIALYSVLLGSVEMRHAPWILWINDLSAKDPYYVLPLIMGVSMLVQTKLNPMPPDPVQAKVMLIMPIVFTGMFLFFPAGLVLYWVVNNLLSIGQQWHITRLTEQGQGADGAK